MRACFLGQNVCALGFGVAMVQALPAEDEPKRTAPQSDTKDTPLPPNPMFSALKRLPHYS